MFLRLTAVCCLLPAVAGAQTLTLPQAQRPAWLADEGIVMAGSWEPLMFRVRRDGGADYTPTPQQRAAYVREHSPAMLDRLQALGVNFVMLHCYKGGGIRAERESMADAVAFARLCHQRGLRVGVYAASGTMMWDLLFAEAPQAKEWIVRDEHGQPRTYGKAAYRYYWNRNDPAAAAYHRQLVRFAVEDIKTDLVHMDNYHVGPGSEPVSVERFRRFMGQTFTPDELRLAGVPALEALGMPTAGAPPLWRYAWADFACQSLADSYHDLSRYARSLRPDILMECNPGGPGLKITPPVDHGRLLTGGEAVWDEGAASGFDHGRLRSRIRSYKISRLLENTTFCYTLTPLEMAESMAFNRDTLGAVCWFEYDQITARPGLTTPVATDLRPFIDFFHRRRELLRGAEVVADVAVLRSFPSQVFGEAKTASLAGAAEEQLIAARVPFQILFDEQLDRLPCYPALVLAGCTALGDVEVQRVRQYVGQGGTLLAIGPLATHDRWMRPRPKPALDDLPADRVVRLDRPDELAPALEKALAGRLSLNVNAPEGLAAELTQQAGRRLLHLVNYRGDQPARDVRVSLALPGGKAVRGVRLASPERAEDGKVTFCQVAGRVEFTVPQVKIYEIAVVELGD